MTPELPLGIGVTPPLVVCCGVGVDSVAVLVGLRARNIRPDLILFADTGSERDETYAYLPTLSKFLCEAGFPPLTVVRYQPVNFKHWPEYHSLEENLLTNVTLPSIAYGGHSCSVKWKIAPMNKFLKTWRPAMDCWSAGLKVRKMIGYDDGTRDRQRCSTFAATENSTDFEQFDLEYPLQAWGWDRLRCIQEIAGAGLPVPLKSSCYFCTAMKPDEVRTLEKDKLRRIVVIEARVRGRDDARRAEGKNGTDGLWRKAVKGMRGATAKPGSMTQFIRDEGLLPAAEVDAIAAATPTHYLYKGDIPDWQTFLHDLTTSAV